MKDEIYQKYGNQDCSFSLSRNFSRFQILSVLVLIIFLYAFWYYSAGAAFGIFDSILIFLSFFIILTAGFIYDYFERIRYADKTYLSVDSKGIYFFGILPDVVEWGDISKIQNFGFKKIRIIVKDKNKYIYRKYKYLFNTSPLIYNIVMLLNFDTPNSIQLRVHTFSSANRNDINHCIDKFRILSN